MHTRLQNTRLFSYSESLHRMINSDTENRLVAARDGRGEGEIGEGGQKIQMSSYEKF